MRIFKDWLIGIVCLVIMGGGVSVMKGSKQLFFEKGVCASDHRGRDLRDLLVKASIEGVPFAYVGTDSGGSLDYPDQVPAVVSVVSQKPGVMGVLICGSGQGMVMTANRFKGIRAALCHDAQTAQRARAHNDANVLVLGRDYVSDAQACAIVKAFLETPFEGGRHQARIEKIDGVS